jgi:hypothetical protein
MHKFLLQAFVAALVLFSFAACETEDSGTVDQTRIFTYYEIFYDKAKNTTTAVAAFRFGNGLGTLLDLTSPSEVSFNGDVLTFNATLGRYEKEYAGQWIKTGTFKFKDTQGNTFTNTTPEMQAADFPATPDVLPLSKSADFILVWMGTPLRQNEQVGALLVGTGVTFGTKNTGAANFIITKNAIANTPTADYVLSMDRWITIDNLTQAPAAGGQIVLKYRAAPKNTQVGS